jgi:hypothetical protein
MSKIIGICGLIGSGKGTVADILVLDHDFKKISFADKVKDGASAIFGWDRSLLEGDTDRSRIWREKEDEFWTQEMGQTVTPRLVLQLLGTDCMRYGFYDGIWVSLVKKHMVENPHYNYVIPDVRFPNEMNMIHELGGEVWQVRRGEQPEWFSSAILDNTTGSNLMDAYKVHVSEWKWIDHNEKFDKIIYNDSTLDQLEEQVRGSLDVSN